MKALIVYEFEGYTLTPTWIDGDPWFYASEVAKILRFKNVRMQISRLAPSEKGVTSSDTLGGEQQVQIVSEIGLYKLCFTSRSPFALKFQEWVANLIKEFRKKGFVIDAQRADPIELQKAIDGFKTLFGHEPRGGVTISPYSGAVVERSGGLKVTELEEFRQMIKRQKRQG